MIAASQTAIVRPAQRSAVCGQSQVHMVHPGALLMQFASSASRRGTRFVSALYLEMD